MVRRPRALLLPALLTLTLGATACGGDDPAASPAPAPSSTAPASPTASASPQPSATPTGPAPTGGSKPSRRPNRTLAPLPPQQLLARPVGSHLLDAARMPTLAEDLPWASTAEAEGDEPVGACQKASLFDIGALRTVERRFVTADGSTTATQVVGRFPDGASAWRAAEVLLAWRADCAERLQHPRTVVGEVRDVPVSTGTGSVYPASYGPRKGDGGRATGFGLVRKGSWLSVVEVATDEARWPSGRNPARQAVRRIAATFRG